jgi:hypothetical protein
MQVRPWMGAVTALSVGMMIGGACGNSDSSNTGGTLGTGGNGNPSSSSSSGFGGVNPAATSSTGTKASSSSSGGSGGTGGTEETGGTTSTSTSTSTSDGGSGGGSMCGEIAPNPQCQSCSDTNCCAEGLACDVGTDCFDLLSCETQGGDASSCGAMYPNGVAPWNSYQGCLGTNCSDVCSALTCAGDELTFGDPNDANAQACTTCVQEQCCDAATAASVAYTNQGCDIDPTCAFDTDSAACDDSLTSAACTGDAVVSAVASCVHDKCADGQGNHLCPMQVCNSGVFFIGDATCADCLSSHCCTQFIAIGCQNGNDCSTALGAFETCVSDSGSCPDGVGKTAYTCQEANCAAECN